MIITAKVQSLALIAAVFAGCSLAAAQSPAASPDEKEGTKTGTITGRVLNDSGQPLPNAIVFIRGQTSQGRTTTTDNEGNFQVGGLDPAIYGVSAAAPTFVSPPRDPDTPPAYYRIGDSVTLSLIKGGVITGTTTSASGEPVVQIGVRAIMVRDVNGKPPPFAYQSERTTDDRGIYRIYGLLPGTYVVAAGGGRGGVSFNNPYDTDTPTFAPSATRDTAAEITVRAGEETAGADIRYRAEPGHTISGVVSGAISSDPYSINANIMLIPVSNGVAGASVFAFQNQNNKGFEFHGVADGDYDLTAQSTMAPGETAASEALRITVKGGDVTGINLVVKALGSISGHFVLQPSTAPECNNKRRPSFAETLVTTRRSENPAAKDQLRSPSFTGAQTSPNQAGNFQLRNLAPGQYGMTTRFFARYWYLLSITLPGATPQPPSSRAATGNRTADVARNWVNLKYGDRVSNLTITLAEGAASLRGNIKHGESEPVPPRLYLHLVPAEKEKAEEVLRFFATPIDNAGAFVVVNLPPGRYWLLVRTAGDNESTVPARLRLPDAAAQRAKLRAEAEAAKREIEFKPCQNVTGYQLPLTAFSLTPTTPPNARP